MTLVIELLKKGSKGNKPQFCELSHDTIKLYKDKECQILQKELELNFDLAIEWLYLGKITKSTKILPPLIGFTLKNLAINKSWQYYGTNELKLQEIQLQLNTKIKQLKIQHYYEVIKKIGEGSFAFVYLVQHRWTHQLYAAKVFNKQKIYQEPFGKVITVNQQFLLKKSIDNEIEMLKKVNHPNILKLNQVFETEHSIYLVTEYLQGASLLQIMNEKSTNFTELKLSKIFKQIFLLLQELHSQGIMHRDLKPENLIFKTLKLKKLKLIDFGLAEYCFNEQFLFPRCGTPGFVAPEIITNKEMKSNYNCACDLFSAGCILHFLLFKQFLFGNDDVLSQLIVENKQCEIDFNDQKYQKISLAAKQLLQGLLEKNPEKRWTAEQALESEFINGEKKQLEINIKSLQQLEIIQQSQDLSTTGKFLQEASPINQFNDNQIIQKKLVACEKKLDSSKKLQDQSKNDSDNSISRHKEINYQTECIPLLQDNVICENMSGLVSPKEIERKKPKLKKSIFKYQTVNMQIGQNEEEEEEKEQNNNQLI